MEYCLARRVEVVQVSAIQTLESQIWDQDTPKGRDQGLEQLCMPINRL